MSTHWKAICGVILVFIFGWVTGGLCVSLFISHRAALLLKRGPEAVVDILERRLTRQIDLDATQKEQIHRLFMQNIKQRRLLQLQVQPQIQQFNRETFEQIDQILRPAQRAMFDDNVEMFRKRFGKYALTPNAEEAPAPETPPAGASTNSGTGGT